VAFELVEFRTGLGLRPLYRGVQPAGTVEAAAAEVRHLLQNMIYEGEGERKRRNAQAWSKKLDGHWHEGGMAVQALRDLLDWVESTKGHPEGNSQGRKRDEAKL
jgi:hypothetical protein